MFTMQAGSSILRRSLLVTLLFTTLSNLLGQAPDPRSSNHFFVGYELGEMIPNRMQNYAFEMGYSFADDHSLRITALDVILTERHLASKYEAVSVDGKDINGRLSDYALNYDYFVSESFYVSIIGGYESIYYEYLKQDQYKLHRYLLGENLCYDSPAFQAINLLDNRENRNWKRYT